VTEASNDKKQLMPMVELIEQQSGQRPEAILADNGYCSEENLESLESAEEPKRRIEGFIATGKQKHGEHRLPAKRGPLPKGATRVERMKRKLKTKAGKAVLCGAQVCGGTAVRADQTGARVSTILATRKREGERGVGAAMPDPQHSTAPRGMQS